MTTPVGVDSYNSYQVSERIVGRRRRAVHRGEVAPGIPRVGASKWPVSGSLLYRRQLGPLTNPRRQRADGPAVLE
jgi:hypothetical protein